MTLTQYLDSLPKASRGPRKGQPLKSALPGGVVLWEGASRIDGKPIVCIATGIYGDSENPKTGAMIQTWILRADIHPVEALATGGDASICGGCIHRPGSHDGEKFEERSCYVNIMGPSAVYRTYRAGKYPHAEPSDYPALFGGKMLRLGSYGDPAAIPTHVWDAAVPCALGHTGYTHQWRSPKLRDTLRWAQLSADSCQDVDAAEALGVGYFRVIPDNEEPLPGEVVCPASEEAGKVATCAECQLCTGIGGANVVIRAHGIGASQYDGGRDRQHSERALARMRQDRARIALPVLQGAS